MKLCDLFTKDVVTAGPAETLASVARQMSERNVGAVVIVEDRRPVGLVTDRDLAIALGVRGMSPQTQVQQVMTPHVLAVPEDAGIFAATTYLRERGVRRLPIVDREDRLVGIVTLDDLLRCLARELYNLAESIKGEMQITKPAPTKPGG
jgi:CBS domain-containing protein